MTQQRLFLVTVSFMVLICADIWADQVLYNHYTSTYGVPCYDACDKQGYDYYWCNTRQGWDYCSPAQDKDYNGNDCPQDQPCGKQGGESHYWCNTDPSGGKVACGPVEPKSTIHMSSKYQSVCKDDCVYDENCDYSWCHTEEGWDYCSLIDDVTYMNKPCRSDHPCGTHGESYSWCYTQSSWDYCGVIKSGE